AVTEAGGASFRARNRTDQTRTGAVLVFNPEEAHASRLDERSRWRYRALYVAADLVREVAETLGFPVLPAIDRNQIDDAGLAAAFGRAHW
ncbi:AraC family ligand binding domain-containing protein, partial [Streptomyces brasiliscabiei]